MDSLQKRYGLMTAIGMVVGIVIGSGIFFKAKDVLRAADGNALFSVLSWVISGFIMVVIATTFAVMATKYEKVNGIVDYAEAACGKTYAYFIGWFMSLIYYPAMTSVLAWVSARYTLVIAGYIDAPLFAIDSLKSAINSPECITLAAFYLILGFFVNSLAPSIAGKFQISSTVVKLVPVLGIALVGTVIGLVSGTLVSNFDPTKVDASAIIDKPETTGLFPAICSTIFAYEGWIVATTINSEIRDSKRNLPIALCVGTLIIVVAYTLYNIGILGLEKIVDVTNSGTSVAFAMFGGVGSTLIHILIVVSCLGTLNGLMLGCCRGIYSLSVRGEGIRPDVFSQVDKKTNVPHNSSIFALMTCMLWFVYFIFAGGHFFGWEAIDRFGFDSSELPIITMYPLYVPILIAMMVKERELNVFRRFVLPALSVIGIVVIVAASIIKHREYNLYYIAVFAAIMAIGALVYTLNKRKGSDI